MTEIRPGGTVHHRRRDQFATVERAGAPDTTWVVFRGESDAVEVSTDQIAAVAEPQPPVVLVWDYGQQPDMDALAKAVREISGGAVHLHQADTGGSDYALVIAPAPLTDQAVEEIWNRHYYGEDG